MSRDAGAERGLLQAMLERIKQTAQQASIQAPDAHEISLALIPGRPSFPRTRTVAGRGNELPGSCLVCWWYMCASLRTARFKAATMCEQCSACRARRTDTAHVPPSAQGAQPSRTMPHANHVQRLLSSYEPTAGPVCLCGPIVPTSLR